MKINDANGINRQVYLPATETFQPGRVLHATKRNNIPSRSGSILSYTLRHIDDKPNKVLKGK